MLDNDMEHWTLSEVVDRIADESIGYIWFVVLSIWGGTVSYLGKIRKGQVAQFSVAELIGEWFVSGFAGLLTAYMCVENHLSWEMTAFLTGIAGHLGGRGIFLFETYFKQKLLGVHNDKKSSD